MLKKILTIIGSTSLSLYLLLFTSSGRDAMSHFKTNSMQIPSRLAKLPILHPILPSPTPLIIPMTPDVLLQAINNLRMENSVNVIEPTNQLCPLVSSLLETNQLSKSSIKKQCPRCINVITAGFDVLVDVDTAINAIRNDATASAIINMSSIRSACILAQDNMIAVVAANITPPSTPPPTPLPPVMLPNISEDQLWLALQEYRHDHSVNELTRDDKLCSYARKRVADQISLYNSHTDKQSYPVPSKYPLDAHTGFKKDADSGYVFEVTNRNEVAENLAYWPTASYATQIIEWGWDTSKEGHRETQLSTEWSAGCLSGQNGFYVAIFAK